MKTIERNDANEPRCSCGSIARPCGGTISGPRLVRYRCIRRCCVAWLPEDGSTSAAALACLLLALVPVGLAVSAVASLVGAVAGVA